VLYIQNIEVTPNPKALKFVVNEMLLKRELRNFTNKQTAENDSLAKAIFEISGVTLVFYTDRFITIEKDTNANWNDLQKSFKKILRHFDKNQIPREEKSSIASFTDNHKTLQKITAIINERIRPGLAGDGGGLDILELKGNELKIRYIGACGNCPSSIYGTSNVIENLLRREINPLLNVITV